MLIKCPECGKEISSKAVMCIGCGCPINERKTPQRTRKYKRLPNGFGTIRNLGAKRRKPYGAYPAVTEYMDNGTPIQQPAIGYFETYIEAFQALVEYNKNPYDLSNNKVTFKEVYELYYKDKYENSKKTFSDSSMNATTSAYHNFAKLHDKVYKDLRTADYQEIIDDSKLSHASLELMTSLIKQMNRFAMQNEIVEKDYAQFAKINIPDDDEKGVPFTEEEINELWLHTDLYPVKILLTLIYTGMRIGELKTARKDVNQGVIVGGSKTNAGKNRQIPIHPRILPVIEELGDCKCTTTTLRRQIDACLESLGMQFSIEGTKHTPHDCRHTFSWLCDKYKVDDLSKHLIMGHSLKKLDIEKSVYGHRTLDELKAEILKIENYNV